MDGPGGEELAEGDGAEFGVEAVEVELIVGEVPAGERVEALAAGGVEFVEELREAFPLDQSEMPEAVERRKIAVFALLDDDACTRDPIGILGMDQMPYNIERPPFVSPGRRHPFPRQPAQKPANRRRRRR